MSIFSWLSHRKAEPQTAVSDSSGLGHVDVTMPMAQSDRLRPKPVQPSVNHAANRKTERLERRELVYGVVRDSMTRAGVLAASFKFKVLSLDVSGHQYLIMVDLANQAAGDTARLAEIEAMIAQTAKMRHNILVTAVYWRVNEHVTMGLSPAQAAPTFHNVQMEAQALRQPVAPARAPVAPNAPVAVNRQTPHYEPLQVDEVAAFKRALASTLPPPTLSAPGQITKSGPRNPHASADFQDTEIVLPEERQSPLSVTQYGDLN